MRKYENVQMRKFAHLHINKRFWVVNSSNHRIKL